MAQNNKQRQLDTLLNKTILDVAVFSALGWSAGLVVSMFFRGKAPVRNLAAGVGGSYGFVNNHNNIKKWL